MVTTTNRTTNETKQRTVGDIQLSFNTAAEYASMVGEINTEIAKRMTEVWLEGFRKQSELSQNTAQQFFKTVEEQGHVDESFFSRSFPFMWAPFVYNPFVFWRE